MYYSTHLVVGASVGFVTGHPVKAIIAGLASHIILDLIPHHDHDKVKYCALDVIGSTLLFALWYITYKPGISLLAGAIAGAFPDIEVPFYYFGLVKKRYFPSHTGWTPHSKSFKPGGVLVQVIFMGVAIWTLS